MNNRKIDSNMQILENGSFKVTIIDTLFDLTKVSLDSYVYKITDYKDKTDLYNKMLDDFCAEYDHDKASVIDRIFKQVMDKYIK